MPPIADGWSQTFTSHTEIQHLSHCGNRCPSNKARPGKGREADEGDHACIRTYVHDRDNAFLWVKARKIPVMLAPELAKRGGRGGAKG